VSRIGKKPIPVPAGYLSFGGAKESALGDLAISV
jgi:hypothetical protein